MSFSPVPQRLFQLLRRYDGEFLSLVAEIERLKVELAELHSQKGQLEKCLTESEQDAAVAAAYRGQLLRELAAAQQRCEELQRREQTLEDEIRRVGWTADVLHDDFIAQRISPQRKHAWLVAAPKSGSTWLTALLTHLLGWQPHMLTALWDRREQEVDLRRMLEFPGEDIFSIQQHCRCSAATKDFVNKFRVRVVLQGRNLYDSIVSLRDHFLQESLASPICFVYEGFAELPPQRQLDAIVDLAVPWYLAFYASWFLSRAAGEVDFFWIDYESLCCETPAALRRITEYLQAPRGHEQILAAIQQAAGKPQRLNVGRAGRGGELLSDEQKQRIARLRSYYPQVDFSPVGL